MEKKIDILNSSVKDTSQIKEKEIPEEKNVKLDFKLRDKDSKEVPDIREELKNMTDHGHRLTIEKLRKENEMLKDSLMQIQDSLIHPVNDSIAKIEQLDKVEENHKDMNP